MVKVLIPLTASGQRAWPWYDPSRPMLWEISACSAWTSSPSSSNSWEPPPTVRISKTTSMTEPTPRPRAGRVVVPRRNRCHSAWDEAEPPQDIRCPLGGELVDACRDSEDPLRRQRRSRSPSSRRAGSCWTRSRATRGVPDIPALRRIADHVTDPRMAGDARTAVRDIGHTGTASGAFILLRANCAQAGVRIPAP
jgi:hypothetical protein